MAARIVHPSVRLPAQLRSGVVMSALRGALEAIGAACQGENARQLGSPQATARAAGPGGTTCGKPWQNQPQSGGWPGNRLLISTADQPPNPSVVSHKAGSSTKGAKACARAELAAGVQLPSRPRCPSAGASTKRSAQE